MVGPAAGVRGLGAGAGASVRDRPGPRSQTHHTSRMDSLPEPSDLVEDEWAAMKIRFNKEGLSWDRLSQEDRTLQVNSPSPGCDCSESSVSHLDCVVC